LKLDALKLAIAAGITYAVCVLTFGITTLLFKWGAKIVWILGTIYIGYAPTVLGSIIGAVWAFGCAFLAAYVLVWIYNKQIKQQP